MSEFTTTDLSIARLILTKDTKISASDSFSAVENGVLDGKKRKVEAALSDRAPRPRSNEGLSTGTYTVSGLAAALVGGTEITVKWNRYNGNRFPAVTIDGERVKSKDNKQRFIDLCNVVKTGVALPVAASVEDSNDLI